MIRVHDMPFGAACGPDGTSFRLWAPAAERVVLRLDVGAGERHHAMDRSADGWHALTVPGAGAGARYRFGLETGLVVPDPASRFQPDDVHAASEVIDPGAFDWPDADWRGRPWEEAVIYELHVGSFTPDGTFAAVAAHLEALAGLGVTAIELMPVADFPGRRNWGYDGAYPFAADAVYGRPEELKSLVAAAHAVGLMVMLDVVYNHFGPDGNYLGAYAPAFFTDRFKTPWGAAIDFAGPHSRTVRDFFIENALYWLEEYHLDGLRLDAVHAIHDPSHPHILTELAETVRRRLPGGRHVHLVLENDANEARRLGGGRYDAQWNDDIHHVLHHMLTGEAAGYYADYTDAPAEALARALTQGFIYQGEPSRYRHGAPRGEPSAHLPPSAFVGFLQNHDQVGNRAFGDRIGALAPEQAVVAATALLLLAPAPPLIFMGEEWDARTPFPFFCDFGPDLADAVREGRRGEFARFPEFADKAARARIPDPNAEATFAAAVLDRGESDSGGHAARRALVGELLGLRARHVVPHLAGGGAPESDATALGPASLHASWRFADGATLSCLVNLGAAPARFDPVAPPGQMLYATHAAALARGEVRQLPPWYIAWFLDETKAGASA